MGRRRRSADSSSHGPKSKIQGPDSFFKLILGPGKKGIEQWPPAPRRCHHPDLRHRPPSAAWKRRELSVRRHIARHHEGDINYS
jgi:hypothetical protein